MPAMKNHKIFMNMFRHPVCGCLSLTTAPKGHSAKMPNLMLCRPNGIPMMVMSSTTPANKYSTAVSNPPNTSHKMLPSTFIYSRLNGIYNLLIIRISSNSTYELDKFPSSTDSYLKGLFLSLSIFIVAFHLFFP